MNAIDHLGRDRQTNLIYRRLSGHIRLGIKHLHTRRETDDQTRNLTLSPRRRRRTNPSTHRTRTIRIRRDNSEPVLDSIAQTRDRHTRRRSSHTDNALLTHHTHVIGTHLSTRRLTPRQQHRIHPGSCDQPRDHTHTLHRRNRRSRRRGRRLVHVLCSRRRLLRDR